MQQPQYKITQTPIQGAQNIKTAQQQMMAQQILQQQSQIQYQMIHGHPQMQQTTGQPVISLVPTSVPMGATTNPGLAPTSIMNPGAQSNIPGAPKRVTPMTAPTILPKTNTTITATPSATQTVQTQQPEPENEIVTKRKFQELVNQISPGTKLDQEVEEILVDIVDDFVESVTTFACNLAKHRKSNTLEVKDVQLHLERNWNIRVPGYYGDPKNLKGNMSDAHKQKLELVKKAQAAATQVKKQ